MNFTLEAQFQGSRLQVFSLTQDLLKANISSALRQRYEISLNYFNEICPEFNNLFCFILLVTPKRWKHRWSQLILYEHLIIVCLYIYILFLYINFSSPLSKPNIFYLQYELRTEYHIYWIYLYTISN